MDWMGEWTTGRSYDAFIKYMEQVRNRKSARTYRRDNRAIRTGMWYELKEQKSSPNCNK